MSTTTDPRAKASRGTPCVSALRKLTVARFGTVLTAAALVALMSVRPVAGGSPSYFIQPLPSSTLRILADHVQIRPRPLRTEAPSQFVETLVEDAAEILADNNITELERRRRSRRFMFDRFDLPLIRRFGRGANWDRRTSSAPLGEAFIIAYFEFTELTANRLIQLFEDTRETGFVRPYRPGGLHTVVETAIRRSDGASSNVVWRVRRRMDSYKVVDIIVEGVSILRDGIGPWLERPDIHLQDPVEKFHGTGACPTTPEDHECG